MLAGVEEVLADLEGRIKHAHRVRRRWRDVGLGGSGAGADDPPARGAPGDHAATQGTRTGSLAAPIPRPPGRPSSGSWRASLSPSRRPMPGRPSRAADAGRGPATEDRAHVLRAPVAQDRTSDQVAAGRRSFVVVLLLVLARLPGRELRPRPTVEPPPTPAVSAAATAGPWSSRRHPCRRQVGAPALVRHAHRRRRHRPLWRVAG